MIIEKTTKTKIGKDTYTNNLETKQILKNDTVIRDYCIIAENEDNNTLTIQTRDKITTIQTQHKDILKKLLHPRKNTKKSRTTTKNKKQEQKK